MELTDLPICPRCRRQRFIPYGPDTAEIRDEAHEAGLTPPALSRMDNETYICSSCGSDEAMRDFAGEPPIPPDRWPVGRPDIGQGSTITKRGPHRFDLPEPS